MSWLQDLPAPSAEAGTGCFAGAQVWLNTKTETQSLTSKLQVPACSSGLLQASSTAAPTRKLFVPPVAATSFHIQQQPLFLSIQLFPHQRSSLLHPENPPSPAPHSAPLAAQQQNPLLHLWNPSRRRQERNERSRKYRDTAT